VVSSTSSLGIDSDLAHVLEHTREVWTDLGGARLFITGGTGFFGRWLLASLVAAIEHLGVRATATVLTRNPCAFEDACPDIAGHPAVTLAKGDVRDFAPPLGAFTHVIHAATPVSATFNREHPREMFDTIVAGSRRVLDFAVESGARAVLLCSSGAVYGRQPTGVERMPEDFPGGPDPLDGGSAYAEGKRAAESLAAATARESGIAVKIARGFAFSGPFLPLDTHFAMGNFLNDALAGRTIRIAGDGLAYRSYLHAADLAIWLWTILARGQSCRAYNVGSEEAVTIGELARLVRRVAAPEVAIETAARPVPGAPVERYVPSTERVRRELGLDQWISLEDGIGRTAAWHRR
jgi:nucleoside-diphosphate-sugar epimerase